MSRSSGMQKENKAGTSYIKSIVIWHSKCCLWYDHYKSVSPAATTNHVGPSCGEKHMPSKSSAVENILRQRKM